MMLKSFHVKSLDNDAMCMFCVCSRTVHKTDMKWTVVSRRHLSHHPKEVIETGVKKWDNFF